LRLFDVTDAAAPDSLGSATPDGCLWYDLTFADGALNRGVWLPLGLYGVDVIPISPLP
jgi:hypothetical protein